jgi:hypothetical protein
VNGGWQWYRLLTAPLFHVGLLHIIMNMMSFVMIGGWLVSRDDDDDDDDNDDDDNDDDA